MVLSASLRDPALDPGQVTWRDRNDRLDGLYTERERAALAPDRLPHPDRGEPRTRCGLRRSAERLPRRGARRTLNRSGHDQRPEYARHRLSPTAPADRKRAA